MEAKKTKQPLHCRIDRDRKKETNAKHEEHCGTRSLPYYHKDWAENFMFYINVPDARQWYEHVSRVLQAGA